MMIPEKVIRDRIAWLRVEKPLSELGTPENHKKIIKGGSKVFLRGPSLIPKSVPVWVIGRKTIDWVQNNVPPLLTRSCIYMLHFRILWRDFQRDRDSSELSRCTGLREERRWRTYGGSRVSGLADFGGLSWLTSNAWLGQPQRSSLQALPVLRLGPTNLWLLFGSDFVSFRTLLGWLGA